MTGIFLSAPFEVSAATVESVTAQLEAIDTLAEMQAKRYTFKVTKRYDYTTTDQSIIDSHTAARTGYETYLSNMFAARAAAQQAFDSLTPEEQAQIDPALTSKLSNDLPTTYLDGSYAVTPRQDEYIFEVVNGPLGFAYEVSSHMVGTESPQTFFITDTSDGATTFTPDGPYTGNNNYELTYCCDYETGLVWGSDYRKINLEDAPLFEDSEAEHIRAIILNSYPFITIEEMKENLKASGINAEYVDSLTKDDIIAGVQMAIWRYSNSHIFEDTYSGYFASISVQKNTGIYFTPYHDYTNEIWEWLPTARQRTFDPAVAYRVNNLIYYLCNLPGQPKEEDASIITDIRIGRMDIVPQSEDIYNVNLHLLLNGHTKAGDNVTLNIVSYHEDESGNIVQTDSATINVGTHSEYALSIGAKYGDTIEVTATGNQNLPRNVYFYEAEGGYKASQSLIGVSGGNTPVYALSRFSFEEDIEAGLRIYKKSSVDQAPISDITFNVYKVTLSADDILNKTPSAEEVAKYAVPENLVGSIVTDSTGYGAIELEKDGIYLVIEEHNPEKIESPEDPFYVSVPYPMKKEVEGENGTETVIEYTDIVSVYPKNTPIVPPPPPPPPPPDNIQGKFTIIKHDGADTEKLLGGAEFAVYQAVADPSAATETLTCGGLSIAVEPVLVNGIPLTLTTDINGSAVSPYLPCGTYYIKETKAPSGYVLEEEALTVTVVSDTIQETTYTYVANNRGFVLPETGGTGTTLFYTLGGTLTVLAALILITRKRVRASL